MTVDIPSAESEHMTASTALWDRVMEARMAFEAAPSDATQKALLDCLAVFSAHFLREASE